MEFSEENGQFYDDMGRLVKGIGDNRNQYEYDKYNEVSVPIEIEEKQDIIDVEENTEITSFNNDLVKNFNIEIFNGWTRSKQEQAVNYLMNMQIDSPWKKGGKDIAYRCEILIEQNRTYYTVAENNLFDMISGEVSSKPIDNAYKIYLADIVDDFDYESKTQVYTEMKKAVKSLKKKPFEFQIEDERGNHNISIPWYDILDYSKDEGGVYIAFIPSPFLKFCLITAGKLPGAIYNKRIPAKIHKPLVQNLYYFLQANKRHKMYATAVEGIYKLSITQFKDIVHCGKSYERNDIERRILKPGKEIINSIEECDFTFEYSFERKRVEKKLETFIIFYISDKYKAKKLEDKVNSELKTIVEGFDYNKEDTIKIIKAFEKEDKPSSYLIQALTQVVIQENAPNVSLALYFIKNGFSKTKLKNKNKFNNFESRTYTDEDFEKILNK